MAKKNLNSVLSDVVSSTFHDREHKGPGPWIWVPGEDGKKGHFKKDKPEKAKEQGDEI